MRTRNSLFKDLIGLALIGVFLYLFFFIDFKDLSLNIPGSWLNVNTIFLSIVIEAVPFILLGVFASALIQTFVSEETIKKFLPKNAIAAIIPAAVLGVIFPVCECAIIPVVRRLIKKGLPVHVGVVLLVGAPILNPVVVASTYYAFNGDPTILYGRFGLAFVLSIVIGFLMLLLFDNKNQLRWTKSELQGKQDPMLEQPVIQNKWKATFYHASDEFFVMGKYLIAGAFIASLFQTFLDRSILIALGQNEVLSPAVMMAFAYVLSLCSEADAFVAASFGSTFTTGSLLAFLIYGPMLDLKNTVMMFAFFRTKFVLVFMAVVTIVVFASILIFQQLVL
ncbi:permease [Sutcliffiella rhizosphaerae]|uniref:Two-component membrane permease complex subunit SMU_747c n=1 Tax=Sutcliffiella rhizosphaerae TaxID=2880967 RepID=A0ABN8AHV8_9BACI|nr:permease [Sutcliffiella rhizosphaerae]CAG9622420.1 Putative two-component membrane permease complex subunit SMU_747c [Sutcliffiella rhizosphaerae]